MNRMMAHAPMTTPMDLLGLRRDPLRHIPDSQPILTLTEKEIPMRYTTDPLRHVSRHETVLRLKDDTITGPDQSVNLAEVTAKLLEQARAIDATFRTLGIDASIADLVRQQMAPDKLPQKMRGTNYLLKTYNAATQRAQDRDWCARVKRAAEAEQAVPLAKRHKDGFARVY